MLYQACAVRKPTKKAEEAGEVDEVIGGLQVVCADTESGAIAQYTQEFLGDEKKLRQVEVIVRPFQ